MEIWEVDKLFLFVAFVIPGFISIKAYQLIVPGATRSASEQLIDAIAYSCINYALLFWLILRVEGSELSTVHPVIYYIFYVVVLFVAPVFWVLLWRWLRTRELFQKNAPHPVLKPWDYVFQQRKPYWVVATLKNGQKIAGRYSSQSFASSAPADEQLYLECTHLMEEDGSIGRAVNDSAGILIMSSEIAYVELQNYRM